jgi:hypothetical protein
MSASVLGKVSLGVGIVPDWLFWLIIWWAGWFAILLIWYDNNKKEPLTILSCFLLFLMSGFTLPSAIFIVINKALRKDK